MSNLFSMEAEQAVIGVLLLEPENFDKISEMIQTDNFYAAKNAVIYSSISELMNNTQPCDMVTVSDSLTKKGELETAGGIPYLAELIESALGLSDIESYAQIIKDRSTMRTLADVCTSVLSSLHNPAGVDIESILEMAQKDVLAISDNSRSDEGLIDGNTLMKSALLRIDSKFNADSTITGIRTGFSEIDELTSGLQKSDLIIVGARPSMGKTTFAMNLVNSAFQTQNDHVAVFSIEVPNTDLMDKLLCSNGKIDAGRVKTGALEQEDWAKLSAAVNLIEGKNYSMDDSSGISPSYIRTQLRKKVRETGTPIALVMIDYLQLMSINGFKEGRTAEITEISKQLKAIAKEFKCPVVALSQLNRSLEQRPNKRPINSDLRDSGAIEQDADVIMFIYRDEIYDDDTPDKGIAEISTTKHRNGEIGTNRLAFIGKNALFQDLAPSYNNDY